MTEAEWLSSNHLDRFFYCLDPEARRRVGGHPHSRCPVLPHESWPDVQLSARKLALCILAGWHACHRAEPRPEWVLPDDDYIDQYRQLVERAVEDMATPSEIQAACRTIRRPGEWHPGHAVWGEAVGALVDPSYTRELGRTALLALDYYRSQGVGEDVLCGILRDIVGNPFRPAILDPSWLTPTVVILARGVYESRDFSAMPILADALQDAGCDNAGILDHCRGSGPHVRGCWVVDLVLGKV